VVGTPVTLVLGARLLLLPGAVLLLPVPGAILLLLAPIATSATAGPTQRPTAPRPFASAEDGIGRPAGGTQRE
jgi:hypothetical protein